MRIKKKGICYIYIPVKLINNNTIIVTKTLIPRHNLAMSASLLLVGEDIGL